MISVDGNVSSESAGLVVAVAHLDLTVTEEQVRKLTQEVLPSTRTMLTKEEFAQFVELLRVELYEGEVGREAVGGDGILGPTQMWGSDTASCEKGVRTFVSDDTVAFGGRSQSAPGDGAHRANRCGRRCARRYAMGL